MEPNSKFKLAKSAVAKLAPDATAAEISKNLKLAGFVPLSKIEIKLGEPDSPIMKLSAVCGDNPAYVEKTIANIISTYEPVLTCEKAKKLCTAMAGKGRRKKKASF